MSAHTHDAGTHDTGHDHGSYRSYIIGFILSVILTAIPFGLVMAGGFESRSATVLLVVAFAVVQIFVHMIYFLHMTSKAEEGWTFMAMMFTIVVVVIMLAGSLWVMHNMNKNMMPQMNHEAMTGFGS